MKACSWLLADPHEWKIGALSRGRNSDPGVVTEGRARKINKKGRDVRVSSPVGLQIVNTLCPGGGGGLGIPRKLAARRHHPFPRDNP